MQHEIQEGKMVDLMSQNMVAAAAVDDALLRQWQQRVVDAAGSGTALRIVGGGSKDWYGQSLQGEVFDTRKHAGVVAYEPSELVITVRCGTPLAELEAELAQQGQMLPFEPPHFAAHGTATVGGMVASGLAGPARASHGCVRDYLLGLQLLDGRGQILNFGGQVMKNVAGYDVSRLMAGALGTLGIILQVSLKVLPRPLAGATLGFEVDEPRALQMMNHWATQALPLSATSWVAGVLCVRLAGAGAAVRAAQVRMGGQVLAQELAQAHWHALREQTHEFFAGAQQLWRLSVPSMTPMLIMPGPLLLEWGGAQRWLRLDALPDAAQASGQAERIRQVVAASGGHATLFRAEANAANPVGVFHPLAPALAQIHANLKTAFDPAGIFNPARMYADSTMVRS
jgi:glycolate oxidase FAD binding subunit